jgi:hypothetical protein
MRDQCYETLHEMMRNHKLHDLHTHLTGMGNYSFWIDTIMRQVVPQLVESKSIEVYANIASYIDTKNEMIHSQKRLQWINRTLTDAGVPLNQIQQLPVDYSDDHSVAMNKKLTCEQLDVLIREIPDSYTNECVPLSDSLREAFRNGQDLQYTHSVVYPTDNLLKASIDPNHPQLLDKSKRYYVYNANLQLFELREGITNEDLLKLMDKDPEILYQVQNAFTVVPRGHEEEIKVKFTPQFYPQRFSLKEAMYCQYLLVLDYLITHICKRYSENGVSYVEFSVTCRHLIFKQWVARHLIKCHCISLPSEKLPDQPFYGVKFNYLAALNRMDVLLPFQENSSIVWRKAKDPLEAAELLTNNEDLVNSCFEKIEFYTGFLNELELMDKAFEKSDILNEKVVGLDYMGDELGFPYCPFWLTEFAEFAKRRKLYRKTLHGIEDPRFGLRAHMGEVSAHYFGSETTLSKVVRHEYTAYSRHCRIVLKYMHKFAEQASHHRYGHGVTIMHAMCEPEQQFEQKLLQMSDQIPIEVNLSSNCYLLNYDHETHPIRKLKHVMPHLIICTDNDGVFDLQCDCPNKQHKSLAAEYCKLIQLDLILDPNTISCCIENSHKHKFE